MALQSLEQIGPGNPLPPFSESVVRNYCAKWRRLYEGDFTGTGIENIGEGIPGFAINWFRRLATFYGEFQFGNRPDILINNDRAQPLMRELGAALFPALQLANVDMIRYGRGVIASHPMDPMRFQAFERDHHYEVQDIRGQVTGDVLWRVRNEKLPDEERSGQGKMADVYKYPVDGDGVWEVYTYNKGGLGSLQASFPIQGTGGRQVVTFDPNNDSTSLYEDIVNQNLEIGRTLARVGFSIKRNLRPHLYAPTGSLIVDDGGAVEINEKGMVWPLEQGDQVPGYLQWDSSNSAVEYYIEQLRTNMFSMVGLSELLFNADQFPGELSGEALRRLLMPFWSKLNHFKMINNTAIEQLLDMWSRNRAAAGVEVLSFDAGDIEILWPWEDLFATALEAPVDEPPLEEEE